MNKLEWQAHYGFDDKDMQTLSYLIELFKGKIVKILIDTKVEPVIL